jgi:hypothetical protein
MHPSLTQLGRLDAVHLAVRPAERRSRRGGAAQVPRSANSQSLEYIANGVRQRPPDAGTIGEKETKGTRPVGVSCSEKGWFWREKRPKVGKPMNVATEPTSEFIQGNASCRL